MNDESDIDEDESESGICDECECNIYGDEVCEGLCSYCSWVADGCLMQGDEDDSDEEEP